MASAVHILSVPYVDPNHVYAATTVLPAVSMVLVGLRLYQRHSTQIGLGLDDWLLLPALVLTIGCAIALLIGVAKSAVATPITPALSNDEVAQRANILAEVQFSFSLTSTLAFGFIKVSIVLMYRRLFAVKKWSAFDKICLGVATLSALWAIIFSMLTLVDCSISISSFNWGKEGVHPFCMNGPAFFEAYLATDLLTDCLIWMLPVPVIIQLQLPWTRKLAILAILGFGANSVIACVIKIVVAAEWIENASVPNYNAQMLSFSTYLYWSMIETGVALNAACLPVLNYYIKKLSFSPVSSRYQSLMSRSTRFSSMQSSGWRTERGSMAKPSHHAWNQSVSSTEYAGPQNSTLLPTHSAPRNHSSTPRGHTRLNNSFSAEDAGHQHVSLLSASPSLPQSASFLPDYSTPHITRFPPNYMAMQRSQAEPRYDRGSAWLDLEASSNEGDDDRSLDDHEEEEPLPPRVPPKDPNYRSRVMGGYI